MDPRIDDLCARLLGFSARDAQEQAHLARMQELCETGRDACARSHFSPGHFTASAFIVSPECDALLLILHAKLERWLQPGGHVEAGDLDLLAAARREAQEEVGLTRLELLYPAPFDLDVHDIPALRGEPPHAHFDVRFLFRAREHSLRPGDDAKEARWVKLADVSLELSDRSVLRAVEKLKQLTA